MQAVAAAPDAIAKAPNARSAAVAMICAEPATPAMNM
jgi:hypothetical protein